MVPLRHLWARWSPEHHSMCNLWGNQNTTIAGKSSICLSDASTNGRCKKPLCLQNSVQLLDIISLFHEEVCKESRHIQHAFFWTGRFAFGSTVANWRIEDPCLIVCKLQGTKPYYEATEAVSELLQRIPPFGDLFEALQWQQLLHTTNSCMIWRSSLQVWQFSAVLVNVPGSTWHVIDTAQPVSDTVHKFRRSACSRCTDSLIYDQAKQL